MEKQYFADQKPFEFPCKAWLAGIPSNHKRIDLPVEVLGPAGMERSYYRVRLECGRVTVANHSMLYIKRAA